MYFVKFYVNLFQNSETRNGIFIVSNISKLNVFIKSRNEVLVCYSNYHSRFIEKYDSIIIAL